MQDKSTRFSLARGFEQVEWIERIFWLLFFFGGSSVIAFGPYTVSVDPAAKVMFGALFLVVLFGALYLRLLLIEKHSEGQPASASAQISQPAASQSPATGIELPYDVDARSALLYAATRTWSRRPYTKTVRPDFALEIERTHDALEEFYELARSGKLHVWGRTDRTRPPRPIEATHWDDWKIEQSSLFGDPAGEPIRTVPRDRLPEGSNPYFDIRLNKAEVESRWPPHELLSIQDAARLCFEETGLFGDISMGGELRLYQFVVLLVMEAHTNPQRLEMWGAQVPSQKMNRIPPSSLSPKNLRENGSEIHTPGEFGAQKDWVSVSVPKFQIPAFIDRLRKNETAGQQPIGDVPRTNLAAAPVAPMDLKIIAVRFRDKLGAQPRYNEAKDIFFSTDAESVRERCMADRALEPYAKELWDSARSLLGCYEALWTKQKVRRNSPGADPGEVKYGYEWGYTNDPNILSQIQLHRAKLADAASKILDLRSG